MKTVWEAKIRKLADYYGAAAFAGDGHLQARRGAMEKQRERSKVLRRIDGGRG